MRSVKPHPNNNKTSLAETSKLKNVHLKSISIFSGPTTFGYKVTLPVISHKIKSERDCLCYVLTSAVECATTTQIYTYTDETPALRQTK